MEYTPPPFFKTGPSPLTRLLFFAVLSLAILVADARFKQLQAVRQIVSVMVYPLQRIAAAPASLARRVRDFFVSHGELRAEIARLRAEKIVA